MKRKLFPFTIIFVFCLAASPAIGQSLLSRSVSLDANRQRLDNVLEIISNKGDFYFSYNSGIVKKDSLVTFSVNNKSVREVLGILFNKTFEFKESGKYIIIRKAPVRMMMVTRKAVEENKIYSVSGYVYDEETGTPINEVSIYEKKLLASVLTNNEGYFNLRLKTSKSSVAALTASKEDYEDTTLVIEPAHSQELSITMMPVIKEEETTIISPRDFLLPDSLKFITDTSAAILPPNMLDSEKVEKTGMGRFLLSSKQKIQSLNVKNFFTTRPFQVSFIPGFGTHGAMASQVVNNFSINILGGYTAGTNGMELGGLFNIDKKDVQYLQAAGLFNISGGTVKGLQLAGINNTVLGNVKALQAAGISNLSKGPMHGWQLGGIYNHAGDSVKGLQAAGVGNFARQKIKGVQLAGVINFSNKETNGVQISGVINYSKKLRGLQIGLINIADSSEGFSIGLINIVLKGYHKLSVSANEITPVNAAFKTGNSKLYSILNAGISAEANNKLYSFGYGLGSELSLNKRRSLTLNPELWSQYLYLGSWNYTNILNKLHLNFNVKLSKYISLFAGPSFAAYISNQQTGISGFRSDVPPTSYKTYAFGTNVTGWFGWNAGINLF